MSKITQNQISAFLGHLAESLDISETEFKKAEEHYQAVSNWLDRSNSSLIQYRPELYPQGSFQLGTVVKPIGQNTEYDIDFVCKLAISKDEISPEKLKTIVGNCLKENDTYKGMIEEKDRCWRLNYAGEFHMDILPAIPNHDSGNNAILIPDKQLAYWHSSNPKVYATWFKEQMKQQFEQRRTAIAEAITASVDEIPEYRVKTTLQQVIQILKRHRDIMFGDIKDKPISIIITTLAAQSYNNESDLFEALMAILDAMPHHIVKVGSVSWVQNPVDARENFADKWADHPAREKKFYEWLEKAKVDFGVAAQKDDIKSLAESLKTKLGDHPADEALSHSYGSLIAINNVPLSFFNVAHRESPKWQLSLAHSVDVYGRYKQNGDWYNFDSNGIPLPKHCDLLFTAKTDVEKPFDVFWQVVNTGKEATDQSGLRGEIFPSKTVGAGGLTQKESTLYKGKHWIECFIVKNGVCVARSGEYIVNIE